jgi:opacity protein-like surface antigen
MKKIISIALILLATGAAALFADSADLLPANVFRFRVIPLFNFADGAFDKDGAYHKYDDGGGASKAFGLGLSLEYGILDWLSLAAQWTPGWIAWSDVDANLGNDSAANANGVSDLFAGVAVQIVGQNAPVKTSLFRATVAPGVKIPFPGPDALDELEKLQRGDAATVANPDKHALGFGARAYFDFIPGVLNRHLIFNLYSEFLGYPLKSKAKNTDIQTLQTAIPGQATALRAYYDTAEGQQALGAAAVAAGENPMAPGFSTGPWVTNYVTNQAINQAGDLDVTFGYDLTLEFEVTLDSIPLDRNQKLLFTAGLPFNYKYSPGTEIGSIDAEHDYLFGINPYVSLFLTNLPLPIQLQLGYNIPVFGVNSAARHVFVLQTKFFLKFW